MSLTEFQLHKQAAEYFRTVLAPEVLWWHTANNPKSAKHGAWLKDMGLLAGVPDFLLYFRNADGWGELLGIEMKARRGRVSDSQIEFGRRLNDEGGSYFVCKSLNDVECALKYCDVPTRGKLAA